MSLAGASKFQSHNISWIDKALKLICREYNIDLEAIKYEHEASTHPLKSRQLKKITMIFTNEENMNLFKLLCKPEYDSKIDIMQLTFAE